MSSIEKQFEELMRQCDLNLDRVEKTFPKPGVNITEEMLRRGITRRQFLKWTSAMTATLMLPPMFESKVARAVENFNRLPVVWLHLAECTGCSESVLRTESPDFLPILLDHISLEYHETLMAPSGYQAETSLEDAIETFENEFVCVVEGAIPTGMEGKYLTIGAEGKTGLEFTQEITSKAAAVISLGSCASFGNLQTANPNPTVAKGIADALGITTVNLPGCPPNPVSFIGTVLYFILFNKLPELDDESRPKFAYGKTVHEFCERRIHFDNQEYAQSWDDENLKNGWCLILLGCKGPSTHNICPRVRWNQKLNWPVGAGHPCIGCSEKDFWDKNSPLYELPAGEETESQRLERYKKIFMKHGIELNSQVAKKLGLNI